MRWRLSTMPTTDRLAQAGVLLWVIVGCGLRVSGIEAFAFSPDDALHVAEARLADPAELLAVLAREDTHPPLHYLLLQALLGLGVQDTALRAASLVPGLLLIPLLYGLGRRLAGRAAGLFAAFLVTFSSALILQAQVIRPYALELALLTGALWFAFDDREDGARRRLAAYGVLMSLAILTHYSAVIAIAAVGSVRLLRIRGQRAAVEWTAMHALLTVIAALQAWLLASLLLDSGFRDAALGDWLAAGFPQDGYFMYWLAGTLAQLVYFADPPRLVPGILLGVLLLIGCIAQRRSHGLQLVQMFLVASGLNLLLAALALYPFADTRHALYMVPFVALLAGAGFQQLWDKATSQESAATAAVIGIGVFALSTVATSAYVFGQDVGRGVVGIPEIPLLREHYTDTLEHIEDSMKPGEVLVGDKQLAYYAWLEGSIHDAERLSEVVGRTRLGSHDFYYYDPARSIRTAAELARFIDGLDRVIGEPRPDSLRFASLGWRSGLLFRLATPGMADLDPQPGDQAIRIALARAGTPAYNSGKLAGGGVVFSVTQETLREGLRRAGLSGPFPPLARVSIARP